MDCDIQWHCLKLLIIVAEYWIFLTSVVCFQVNHTQATLSPETAQVVLWLSADPVHTVYNSINVLEDEREH